MGEDASKRSTMKNKEFILKEGELVPKEVRKIYKPKNKKLFQEKKKSSRSSSKQYRRSKQSSDMIKIKKEKDDEIVVVGDLWEDASKRSKCKEIVLKDGDLVPKEALKPIHVHKSIKNMKE